MSTSEAAIAFLETDGPFKVLKARHEEATKVLKAWFHAHPDALKYRGQVGYRREGPWPSLDIELAKKTLGDDLASCQVDRYRESLFPLRGPPA